jgi:hypothetical protein
MSELVEEFSHDNTGEPVTVKTVLLDPSLFLEPDCWFQLLQDDSREMTFKKLPIYHNPPKGKPKRKYRLIAHGRYFYQNLYQLATEILALLENQ